MSDNRTEDPTPGRLRELRRRGDVPYSARAVSTAALFGALIGLLTTAPTSARTLAALTSRSLDGTITEPLVVLGIAVRVLLAVAGPPVVCAAMAAIIVGLAQTGGLFAVARIGPDARRFAAPLPWSADRRRMLAPGLAIGALGVGAALVGAAIAFRRLASGGAAIDHGLDASVGLGMGALTVAASLSAAGALAAGATDLVVQRAMFFRRHRMTRQEVIDEYKRSEGDPEHKARRLRAHRELLAGDIRAAVGQSDVVLRNPTHVAVGLRYRPGESSAPTVTAAAHGDAAKQMVREARRRGVPEVHDVRTARAAARLDPGEAIPPELFEPVAIIFRWLRDEGLLDEE
jgi:type III secretion protein U